MRRLTRSRAKADMQVSGSDNDMDVVEEDPIQDDLDEPQIAVDDDDEDDEDESEGKEDQLEDDEGDDQVGISLPRVFKQTQCNYRALKTRQQKQGLVVFLLASALSSSYPLREVLPLAEMLPVLPHPKVPPDDDMQGVVCGYHLIIFL